MHQRKRFLALFIALLLMAGCAGSTGNVTPGQQAVAASYKALATAQVTYDQSMKALADLDKQGKLKPEDKALAIKFGNQFRDAYLVAVTALQAGKGADIAAASEALSKLVALVGQLTGGGKP